MHVGFVCTLRIRGTIAWVLPNKSVHALCHMNAEPYAAMRHMHSVCHALAVRHIHVIYYKKRHACMLSIAPLQMCAGLCRVRLDWKFATLCKPGETMGDMPFALYGPDMYQVPSQAVCQLDSHSASQCLHHCA